MRRLLTLGLCIAIPLATLVLLFSLFDSSAAAVVSSKDETAVIFEPFAREVLPLSMPNDSPKDSEGDSNLGWEPELFEIDEPLRERNEDRVEDCRIQRERILLQRQGVNDTDPQTHIRQPVHTELISSTALDVPSAPQANGMITGVITDADTGLSIHGINVDAFDYDSGW